MTTQTKSPPRAWYALRRTLPIWSFEENLAELVACLPRYGVDEVIIKIDTEEFTHGQPLLPWVKRYQKRLYAIREAMTALGIVYSINPWITLGHNDRGRDSRQDLPGLRTMVGHDGTLCTCCACPLSQAWRSNVDAVWTLYAETKPHVVWVEDDIRTFNHNPVRFGCFCPLHMKRFSERIGRKVTREELVAAILKPGKPHAWRKAYLEMQGEIMTETVAFLARVVHRTSPETRMGLMSSGPANHCMDGRDWNAFAAALADGRPLYSRPPMSNYDEGALRGFYYSHDSIKNTRFCLPEGVIEQTEVENVPFTRYSKSATFTFLEMAVSFAYGSHGVTMNLFDHCGTPMEREPAFGQTLAQAKPYLEGMARRLQPTGRYRGVQLLHHDQSSCVKRLSKGAPYYALAEDGGASMWMLEAHGIPTTYDREAVVATSGQVLRAFSDDELRDFLSRGMLLDAVAAEVLCERGFAAQIGLTSMEAPCGLDTLGAYAAEEFFNPAFGGAEKKFLTLTLPGLGGRPQFSVMRPARSATVISRIVDADANRHHVCMYAFENDWGGRVVVHALDHGSAYGVSFNHTFRAEQFQGAVRWLARDEPPLLVHGGVYPLALRKELPERTVLGLFNLTLDAWPETRFEFAESREPAQVLRLTPSGRWVRDRKIAVTRSGACMTVRYGEPVDHTRPLFISLEWDG